MTKCLMYLPTLLFLLSACGKSGQPQRTNNPTDTIEDKGFVTPMQYDGYRLVWNDEFEQSFIDTAAWIFEVGNGNNGWGNNELEYYTFRQENASLKEGYLVITALKENYLGAAYTSARMITKGRKSFLYGRVDIRARVPEGQGIWPALWMLGDNIDSVGWPACGEIDIMELVGHVPNTVHGTLHWGKDASSHRSKGNSYTLPSEKFSNEFHVFSLIWEAGKLDILVDGKIYFSFAKQDVLPDEYPFDAPHFFLFNVAVGGNWPGQPNATTSFPQEMIVDYIRVFQK